MRIREYVSAMRLRTLPLSLSGVSLGAMLAAADYYVNWHVVLFLLITASCLQILSNVCNELGDYRRGVLSAHEREATAALRDGKISEKGLEILMRIMLAASVVSGLTMIRLTYGRLFLLESFILMIFGYLAIRAAMNYTLGRNPYGYRGFGDIYVFVFFGFLAVWGAYYVCSHTFGTLMILLPAATVGFFSMGVLNVNNLRDMDTDRGNRVTVALKLGEKGARIYQTALIAAGWITMLVYVNFRIFDIWHYLFLLTLPLFVWHLTIVWKSQGKELDKALPVLVLGTLAFAMLAGLGFILFLF